MREKSTEVSFKMANSSVKVRNKESGKTMEVTPGSAEGLKKDKDWEIVEDEEEEEEKSEEDGEELDEYEMIDEDEDDKLTVKIESSGKLEAGQHKGAIIDLTTKKEDVSWQEDKAKYLEVTIEVPRENDESVKMTPAYSMESKTPQSMLGKLLQRFGANIEGDEQIDIKNTLLGQKAKFLVEKDDNGYSSVKRETVKPA